MEFWGVEVKSGISLDLHPGEDMVLHISQMSLGENKNNEKEPIRIYLKIGEKKLIIGTLSHEKFPQLATEIILEKGFQLSHSWRHGSVFFTGYRVDASEPDEDDMDEDASEVAAPEIQPAAAKQVNFKLPNEEGKAEEDESESEDEDSSDDESDEEEKKVTAEVDNKENDDEEDDSSDSDDEDDDSSEDEEDTPKKPKELKKRSSAEANTSKDSTSSKKAKFVTPQKTETKKPPHVHVATPHPAKGKNSGSNGEASKTPKSGGGGSFGCKSCDRKFGSEMGLQSHTKAKHSAAA